MDASEVIYSLENNLGGGGVGEDDERTLNDVIRGWCLSWNWL